MPASRSSRLVSTLVVGTGADGSQESDPAAVTSTPRPGYPGGLLVVQDGAHTTAVVEGGEERTNTSFKLVAWRKVQRAAGLTKGRQRTSGWVSDTVTLS